VAGRGQRRLPSTCPSFRPAVAVTLSAASGAGAPVARVNSSLTVARSGKRDRSVWPLSDWHLGRHRRLQPLPVTVTGGGEWRRRRGSVPSRPTGRLRRFAGLPRAWLVPKSCAGVSGQAPTIFLPAFFTFFDSRFSLRDLPGFFALGFCGDLSGICPPSFSAPYPAGVGRVGAPSSRRMEHLPNPPEHADERYLAPLSCRSRAVLPGQAPNGEGRPPAGASHLPGVRG
jgi:hypothetical protein